MEKFIKLLFFGALLSMPFVTFAQAKHSFNLEWEGVENILDAENQSIKVLRLNNAYCLPENNYAPLFSTIINLPLDAINVKSTIENMVFQEVDRTQQAWITHPIVATADVNFKTTVSANNGSPQLRLSIFPFRTQDGVLQQLVSFDIEITFQKNSNLTAHTAHAVSKPSVLASGNWYKIRLDKTGIYKITYDDLKNMGINMSSVKPDNIRVFGKGSMLHENVTEFNYDGLPENAIQVVTANSNTFAPGDYFLFYATGPDLIYYNPAYTVFTHRKNVYSNYSYFFLNFDTGKGKRIEALSQPTNSVNLSVDRYLDFQYFNKDLLNTGKSGQQWVGDKINAGSYEFPTMYFPNAISGESRTNVKCRILKTSEELQPRWDFYLNEAKINTGGSIGNPGDYYYGLAGILRTSFSPIAGGSYTFKVKIPQATNATTIYVDYLETNVLTKLVYKSGYVLFSNPFVSIDEKTAEYKLAASNSNVTIWDVSNPNEVKKVNSLFSQDTTRFVTPMQNNIIRTFVAWENSGLLKPEFVEKVANQDITSFSNVEMLIVSTHGLLSEARRLADHHRTFDGFTVEVVEQSKIHNEFSSGSPDPSGIRDYCRFLYNRPDSEKKLRYLLLFGKATYDVRNLQARTKSEIIPAYETVESMSSVYSCATDDYFGILSSKIVLDPTDEYKHLKPEVINIGVGRFPVSNIKEAKVAVKKTIDYATKRPQQFGIWRNVVAFVTDDGDVSYARNSETTLNNALYEHAPECNVSKLYSDAYKQESTPSGQRYPTLKEAINEQMRNGALIMNYAGHGGNEGWADELFLDRPQINSWTNYKSMPVFITATCEFSHYDNPDKGSPGEEIFLNPAGGGIALYSTSRATYGSSNLILNAALFDTLFSRKSNRVTRLGDAMAYAKNQAWSEILSVRSFVLLGDPALELAFPKYKVKTTAINRNPVSSVLDTLKASGNTEIEGSIVDWNGTLVSSFNGEVDIKIYDKKRATKTLANDGGDPYHYTLQDNIVYQGKATVTNGLFKTLFILPSDINLNYGFGRISYYANTKKEDATGVFEKFIIGGVADEIRQDTTPPKISLFINNERFKNGDITHENPLLIVKLFDESGISTVGAKPGHDIVAILDNNSSEAISLNKYYTSDLDSYQSGKVYFQFKNLAKGEHTLSVKVWDVFLNSSEATINFVVDKDYEITITSIQAFPVPFVDGDVNIYFEHNKYNSLIETTVEVFSITGQQIWQHGPSREYVSEGYSVGPIYWDGHDANGNELNTGLYLCRIRIKDSQNQTADKTIKLVKVAK